MRLTPVLWSAAKRLLRTSHQEDVMRISGLSNQDWQTFWKIVREEWKPTGKHDYQALSDEKRSTLMNRINARLVEHRVRKVEDDVGDWALYWSHKNSWSKYLYTDAKQEWASKFTNQREVDPELELSNIHNHARTVVEAYVATQGITKVAEVPQTDYQKLSKRINQFCEKNCVPPLDGWLMRHILGRKFADVQKRSVLAARKQKMDTENTKKTIPEGTSRSRNSQKVAPQAELRSH